MNKKEMKEYIRGAGACLVTKSVLNGERPLRWFFRDQKGIGNGWVAFGDGDDDAYVNNADNFAIVDFNTLANIEPTVLNVLYMPVGTDLEFKSDASGKYFVDTKTGEEIRKAVKHPMQEGFEKNLKFLNQKEFSAEFIQGLFEKSEKTEPFIIGELDCPTGELLVADPLVYLGNEKYTCALNRTVPPGAYPVELSVLYSSMAGLRYAAARLMITNGKSCCYELAMPKGYTIDDYNKPGIFSGFGVDAGMACFCDSAVAKEYDAFLRDFHDRNPNANHYDDYFAAIFAESFKKDPRYQREGGDYIAWSVPGTGHRLPMFASGLGDGIYSSYWGLSKTGEVMELVILFMNPDFF